MILESLLYVITHQQSLVCSLEIMLCNSSVIIAAPDNFYPQAPLPAPDNIPDSTKPIEELLKPGLPKTTPIKHETLVNSSVKLTKEADKIAAQRAWKYFERNWNPQTGLVNSVDNLSWTTWWDQGSAVLGIHAAKQLRLLPDDVFHKRINTLLQTLEKLPLPATGLPNKAYSTSQAQMRTLSNNPDVEGKSGWSVLDLARFLLALHVLRSHYPEYSDRINRIVAGWNLADQSRGYFSGRYENRQLGINASVNVNTNAVILESLLYQARDRKPLVF